MLNPKLNLNSKLFDSDVEKLPTRAGFGEGILQLGDTDPSIVCLCADLIDSTKLQKFANKYPERFFEMGVAEQNMAAVGAGLGVSGKTVFISSYATFSPGKNWETIRTTIIYNQSNVKIAGHHCGILTGPDGATHQATEDIASVRPWPGIEIYVPADAIEAKKATIASAKTTRPVYLRFSRDKTPIITTEKTPFAPGILYEYWVSDKPQATLFATGYVLYYALIAALELEAEGFPVNVVNASTIKPLDASGILSFTAKSKAIVTIEDHQVTGGLGGAIAEFLAKTTPLPMEFIGLQDTFAESGKPKELIEKYGLGASSIKKAVKKVIKRKTS